MAMDYDDLKLKAAKIPTYYATDDLDIAFYIRYVGSEESCTIEVEADGDIVSLVGDTGSEAADANFLEAGGTAGTIDVSDANADTIQEVITLINALDDYVCWAKDSLPDESSDDTLLLMTATQAKGTNLAIHFDTSVRKALSIGVTGANEIFSHKGHLNQVWTAKGNVQTTSGAGGVKIYECDDVAGTKTELQTKAIDAGNDVAYTATELSADGISSFGKRLVFWYGSVTTFATGTGTGVRVLKRTTPIEPLHWEDEQFYENW